ncbi:hypothetical protein [Streptomyces sp. NPDC057460]|uniref:hypothetical protein n=1 Tax=Streptomyces sp. NPDC057460 TaxID=3346141 RepID=UPI0036BD3C41
MFAKIPLASLDVSDLTDKAEVSSELAGEDLIRAARDMLPDPANSVTKVLGVSVGTHCNHIPELKELRDSRVPRQLEGTSQPTPTAPCCGGRRHEL